MAKRDAEKQTGTEQYAAMVRRLTRSYGRKAREGELDITALEQLVEIRKELDEQTAEVVRALRTEQGGAYSWQQIGDALGMTKGAALRKFGADEGDARKAGGQPAERR